MPRKTLTDNTATCLGYLILLPIKIILLPFEMIFREVMKPKTQKKAARMEVLTLA